MSSLQALNDNKPLNYGDYTAYFLRGVAAVSGFVALVIGLWIAGKMLDGWLNGYDPSSAVDKLKKIATIAVITSGVAAGITLLFIDTINGCVKAEKDKIMETVGLEWVKTGFFSIALPFVAIGMGLARK